MALAVAYAMTVAYILSRSFIPSRCATWLKPHKEHDADEQPKSRIARAYERWDSWINKGIEWYGHLLDWTMAHRWLTVLAPLGVLIVLIVALGPILRREFFPEVDSGSFEMYVRAPTGTRIERTEDRIKEVEKIVKKTIGDDLDLVISELGVWADWSAAYTPNSGPMDSILRIQLKEERKHTAQFHSQALRTELAKNERFADMEFAFNTGGTIRSALNEGRPTPINLRIEGKHTQKAHELAEKILREVKKIDGVVDARILQRLDYPEFVIEVDRAKARAVGLTEEDIMKSVISALNSSIQFNKQNFWIDTKSQNQYFVGVQYAEKDIQSLETVLNVSITSPGQKQAVPLSNFVHIRASSIAAEVSHDDLQSAIDLEMNIHGRDLGHIADDIERMLDQFGKRQKKSFWATLGNCDQTGAAWIPYDPEEDSHRKLMEATKMKLSGEYGHMTDTFTQFGIGLTLAVVFVYFLMVSLLDSYIVPLLIMYAVPLGGIGIIPMLWITNTAINVQSLLGMIFVVGILVSHKVLLTDFAEERQRSENLSPTEAIVQAAKIRVRPVMMTLLAAILALIPMSLALEKGSEANAPLGRAVIGGLLSSIFSTLFVTPALYSLAVREEPKNESQIEEGSNEAEGHHAERGDDADE
jgi:multidrug efflux pump subunit AcrB